MATPSEKLADALDTLHALQNKGMIVIHTDDIRLVHEKKLFLFRSSWYSTFCFGLLCVLSNPTAGNMNEPKPTP